MTQRPRRLLHELARRTAIAVLIAAIPLLVLFLAAPYLPPLPEVVWPGALLLGLAAALFHVISQTRGLSRVLTSLLLVIGLPVAVTRLYREFGVLLGLETHEQAATVTLVILSVGFGILYALKGLPLISKELREQAARKRTFVLRMLYASLLYATAYSFAVDHLVLDARTLEEVLGQGGEILRLIAPLQFAGVYLFMPALCCSLITSEKERDTLTLLLLTRVTPGRLLAGKFLSRLLPMLFFILLCLPLIGFAYSLGGLDLQFAASFVWLLCVTTIQTGAISLMFSCWFRTTVGAFIASYVTCFVMAGGTFLIIDSLIFDALWEPLGRWLDSLDFFGLGQQAPLLATLPVLAIDTANSFLECVLQSTPALILTSVCLALARVFVVRRATVKPRNWLLQLFRGFDRLFSFLNRKLCGGIVVLAGERHLSRNRPIAWRETTHRTMGTGRYLIRMFMLIEYPILFLCSISVGPGTGLKLLSLALPLVWVVVVLLICGAAASVISAERGGQTLDVLLSTPMTGGSILRQKLTGLRRLIAVLSVPLLTIYIFQAMLRFDVPDLAPGRPGFPELDPTALTWTFLWSGIAHVVLLLPLISWLAFWIGLRIRSQGKAIITSVSFVAAWSLLPMIAWLVLDAVQSSEDNAIWEMLCMTSPMMNVHLQQYSGFVDPLQILGRTICIYGGLLLVLRFWFLWRAPRVLGRADTSRRVARKRESQARRRAFE